jgi:hypothetical protein
VGARTAAGVGLVAVGLALALASLPVVVGQKRAVDVYDELADVATRDEGERTVDWDALLAANSSVVAWCRVEGTTIDHPVCQASDEDPTFWLTHDLWGAESPAGTPYIDHRTRADSLHVLCYGHHLAGTGGMFSDVYRCHEQGKFEGILTGGLLWLTPDGGAVRMEPLCASSQDMGYARIQRFEFADDAELRAWLRDILSDASAAAADAEELLGRATRAVTLVTCCSDIAGQRGRTLVTFVGS